MGDDERGSAARANPVGASLGGVGAVFGISTIPFLVAFVAFVAGSRRPPHAGEGFFEAFLDFFSGILRYLEFVETALATDVVLGLAAVVYGVAVMRREPRTSARHAFALAGVVTASVLGVVMGVATLLLLPFVVRLPR